MTHMIAVDVGNSSIKIGIENAAGILRMHRFASAKELPEEILPVGDCRWCVCSVNQKKHNELAEWVAVNRPADRLHLICNGDIPMRTDVENLESVGTDRLVAAWTSNQYRPANEQLVVVDAGTAVTIDVLDVDGTYLGGVIFAGLQTSVTSLGRVAEGLPNLYGDEIDVSHYIKHPIGKMTRDAILSGSLHSQLEAMRNIPEMLSPSADVVATGGQTTVFKLFLPESWKLVAELVLQGTLEIGKLID